jgi:hypothetical protein
MSVIDSKTDGELLRSLLAENAKATNEIRCAQRDLAQAQNRLAFTVAVLNELIHRQEIK